MAQKQYGLIKPEKSTSRLAAFNSDSDSDDEPAAKKKVFTGMNLAQKRLAEKAQEKALAEDPTIFQYDEVYDDMAAKKDEAKIAKKSESKEAKYIAKLLVTADKRKKDYERRTERKVQKERETEGDMYADKEIFVTRAYRAKLEEMKKAEEEERREEYLESIGDVTKQRDLGGFYRHLYEQKMGAETKDAAADEEKATNATTETSTVGDEMQEKASKKKKQRTYRRRQSKDNDDDEQTEGGSGTKAHLPSNLDADSDFSIDSSSSEDEEGGDQAQKDSEKDTDKKTDTKLVEEKVEEVEAAVEKVEDSAAKPEHEFAMPKAVDDKDKDDSSSSSDDEAPPEVKVKIDIWKKRTVDDVFDAALQRFYERKMAREG